MYLIVFEIWKLLFVFWESPPIIWFCWSDHCVMISVTVYVKSALDLCLRHHKLYLPSVPSVILRSIDINHMCTLPPPPSKLIKMHLGTVLKNWKVINHLSSLSCSSFEAKSREYNEILIVNVFTWFTFWRTCGFSRLYVRNFLFKHFEYNICNHAN